MKPIKPASGHANRMRPGSCAGAVLRSLSTVIVAVNAKLLVAVGDLNERRFMKFSLSLPTRYVDRSEEPLAGGLAEVPAAWPATAANGSCRR